jgi:hypothetical protein
MRYSFPQLQAESRFQTYNIVRRALLDAGHTVFPELTKECDAVLFSACDVLDIRELRALRKRTSKPIIIGGSYAFNYWSAILYSDIVWIGEIFDFAELNNLADITNSGSAFAGQKKQLFASQRIDWGSIPITQISKHKAYYWGGVGCKNRCKFCFTSWTHFRNDNDKNRILHAHKDCAQLGVHLMISANFYENDSKSTTKDYLLRDYLTRPVSAQLIRCGVEFATDKMRKLMGKEVSRNDIYAAIQKMDRDNTALRLFHITGYETLLDWDAYIDDLAKMLLSHPNKRLLHLMFNNIQYQNYTPLYTERRFIDPGRYVDFHTTKAWYNKLRQYSTHILVGAPSPFQHVACRMGIELAQTIPQAEYWFKMLGRKDKTTKDESYRALFSSGVLSTPRMVIKRDGRITEVVEEESRSAAPAPRKVCG